MGKFYGECADSLTLCVRTVAWLDATLKPPKRSKPRSPSQDEQPSITRRRKLRDDGVAHEMPDPGPAEYLLDILFDVGPVHSTGMGEVPIGYEQLAAWERVQGLRLSPWESRTLRDLSIVYCHEKAVSGDPGASAPGSIEESPEQAAERRDRVAKDLSQALRSFKRN